MRCSSSSKSLRCNYRERHRIKIGQIFAGHEKVALYLNPCKEVFYKKLGFNCMSTAMPMFKSQDEALELGW